MHMHMHAQMHTPARTHSWISFNKAIASCRHGWSSVLGRTQLISITLHPHRLQWANSVSAVSAPRGLRPVFHLELECFLFMVNLFINSVFVFNNSWLKVSWWTHGSVSLLTFNSLPQSITRHLNPSRFASNYTCYQPNLIFNSLT